MRLTTKLVLPALVTGLVCGVGCRSYRGAGAGGVFFDGLSGSGSPTPTRASGAETRSAFTLANGLRVILEENHATSAVAVQVWIDAGAAHDPGDRPGVSSLLKESLMQSPVLAELTAAGGTISAWVSHDQVVYRAVMASSFLTSGLRSMSAALSGPRLGPEALELARPSAILAARQTAWDPRRLAVQLTFATAYPGGEYALPVEGTPQQIAHISAADLRSFHELFYSAPRTVLVVVGDFGSAVVRADVTAIFGAWQLGAHAVPDSARSPVSPPSSPSASAARVIVATADVARAEIAIGFRTPAVRHGDVPTLEMLAALASRDGSGGLALDLVRNRQIATRAGAFFFGGRHGGMLVARATLASVPTEDGARALIDEMLRFGRERVDPVDLDRARTTVEGDDAAHKSSLDGYAARLGWFASLTGDAGFEKKYRERFKKVDGHDVQATAARYLRASNMVIAAVIPAPAAGVPADNLGARAVAMRLQAVMDECELQPPVPLPVKRAAVSAVGQDFVDYRLASGMRLLVIPDDTATQISVRALWSGGGRVDDARLSGTSALIARLLPRGTRRGASSSASPNSNPSPNPDMEPDMEGVDMTDIAGTMEGVAGADVLGLRADFLASRWERGLELVADVLCNPRFEEDDLERERRVQLDLIRRRDEDPSALALRVFRETLYGAHPYRRDVLGTPESVSALTRRRLLDHFRRNYRPAGLTVAVVGAVSPARVAAKVQALFGGQPVPLPVESPSLPQIPHRAEPVEISRSTSKATGHVMLGYLGLSVRDPDRYALEVIAEILGGSPGGRLASPVDMPESAGAGPSVVAYEALDPGFFAISLPVRPEAIDAVVPRLRAELARLAQHGATPAELVRARQLLVGRAALALQRRGAIAMALSLHGALGQEISSYRGDSQKFATVSLDDVARVARRVLDPAQEVLVVVRPRDPDRSSDRPIAGMN